MSESRTPVVAKSQSPLVSARVVLEETSRDTLAEPVDVGTCAP